MKKKKLNRTKHNHRLENTKGEIIVFFIEIKSQTNFKEMLLFLWNVQFVYNTVMTDQILLTISHIIKKYFPRGFCTKFVKKFFDFFFTTFYFF